MYQTQSVVDNLCTCRSIDLPCLNLRYVKHQVNINKWCAHNFFISSEQVVWHTTFCCKNILRHWSPEDRLEYHSKLFYHFSAHALNVIRCHSEIIRIWDTVKINISMISDNYTDRSVAITIEEQYFGSMPGWKNWLTDNNFVRKQ